MWHLVRFSENVVISLPVIIVFFFSLVFWISYENFYFFKSFSQRKWEKVSALSMIIWCQKETCLSQVLPSLNNATEAPGGVNHIDKSTEIQSSWTKCRASWLTHNILVRYSDKAGHNSKGRKWKLRFILFNLGEKKGQFLLFKNKPF